MEAGETVSLELKQRTDESLNQMNELKERLTELEQKGARRPNDAPAQRKSLGELVVESEEFKGWTVRPVRASASTGTERYYERAGDYGHWREPQPTAWWSPIVFRALSPRRNAL
jgi:hypothetical protein